SPETLSVGVRFVRPAQLTRISTLPNSLTAAPSRACRLDRSVTSVEATRVLQPRHLISLATFSTKSVRRPVGTTFAPAWARPLASARPIPDVPPMTTAVLPVRSRSGCPMGVLHVLRIRQLFAALIPFPASNLVAIRAWRMASQRKFPVEAGSRTNCKSLRFEIEHQRHRPAAAFAGG